VYLKNQDGDYRFFYFAALGACSNFKCESVIMYYKLSLFEYYILSSAYKCVIIISLSITLKEFLYKCIIT